MEHDPDERPGWVRLPGYEQQNPATSRRADGVRRVRRASNWTAAALIAGAAAATGYFAHHTPPVASTATQTTQTQPGSQPAAAGHIATAGPHQASGSAPVVTSGGSGVAVGSTAGTASGAGGRTATVTWRDN